MKKIFLIFWFILTFRAVAQDLSAYTHLIVPKKFEFLKHENQYQLNTLTRFLLEEKGFTVVYDDVLPEELTKNRCLGLQVHLENNSTMFVTRLQLVLKDCKNVPVLTSAEGINREKDYKKAYQGALRKALEGIKAASYYRTSKTVAGTLPTAQTESPAPTEPSPLYAQPIANGFQLVDSAPKVLYVLQKTELQDLYILKDKNGILYRKDDKWIIEYYVNETWKQESVLIKF